MLSGRPSDGLARRALAVAALPLVCASLTLYLGFVRRAAMRIEGEKPIALGEFGTGATVTHAFLMTGDGLRRVAVRISADQPLSLGFALTLSRLDDSASHARDNDSSPERSVTARDGAARSAVRRRISEKQKDGA